MSRVLVEKETIYTDEVAMLMQGATYTEVIAATNISSATLSRVSRCVRHGSGGYEKFVPQAEKED